MTNSIIWAQNMIYSYCVFYMNKIKIKQEPNNEIHPFGHFCLLIILELFLIK